MKGRPVPVIIVAILFIVTGCIGFVYHAKELFDRDHVLSEVIWILVLRILAVLCGVLLLYRINWARWLAVAWMLYHVVIGALNSVDQMIAHIIFLVIIVVLLFLPVSSKYFRLKNGGAKK
ncbi:hypothetical protein QTN47_19810 [Danxiaibacter flavus]|uniref:Uncharacterized protein n=1 Tax=Danxiaibacter flavus TaxID=3049108 RepID=A0ABV3ZIQ2_9BACT|nr:hypothetical protein QNM32_19820 [Chitinophagaceae bacterium DXS]